MNDTGRIGEILSRMTLHQKVMLCTGKNSWRTRDYEELGIPSILVSDGTNGVRFQKGSDNPPELSFYELLDGSFDSEEALANTFVSTCYPSGSAIACTWDRELTGRIGRALAEDCRSLGINMLLGPGMNIHRTPLTARNFEYYSEDPVLTGEMAAAIVAAVQSEGVGTCMKHFACHNSDTRRTRVNVQVSERALREIYLAGYERVVKKAHPTAMMSAYNKVNGEETSGDNRLTRDIVKGEWGFDGAIFCDWGAVKDPAAATRGAIDLQMPFSPSSAAYLEKEIREGRLPEDLLDRRAERILRLVFLLKEWEKNWPRTGEETAGEGNRAEAHHRLAREAAAESMVLLRNEGGVLPLRDLKGKKVAVLGRMAKEPHYQGTGCAIVHTETVDNPWECLQPDLAEAEVRYAEGYLADGSTTEELLREAEEAARGADVCLVFAGCFLPREDDDYNRKDIRLPEGMEALIDRACSANDRVAVVLSGGEVCEMPWRHRTAAVLLTWFSGEGMGRALAEILTGRISPSGRLANTVPETLQMTPAWLSMAGNIYDIPYTEDIYVGYRWYDRRGIAPAYPFGYGLSYSTFAYGEPEMTVMPPEQGARDGAVQISLPVTNTGEMRAAQVIQLYIRPLGQTRLPRPVRELKDFVRLDLAPGETGTAVFRLEDRDFAYYAPDVCDWVTEAGEYAVECGISSREMVSSVTVSRQGTEKVPPLRRDAGFHELFQEPARKESFFRFLVEQGLVTPEQVGEKLEQSLLGTFWAVSAYLDMNSGGRVSLEDYWKWVESVE